MNQVLKLNRKKIKELEKEVKEEIFWAIECENYTARKAEQIDEMNEEIQRRKKYYELLKEGFRKIK